MSLSITQLARSVSGVENQNPNAMDLDGSDRTQRVAAVVDHTLLMKSRLQAAASAVVAGGPAGCSTDQSSSKRTKIGPSGSSSQAAAAAAAPTRSKGATQPTLSPAAIPFPRPTQKIELIQQIERLVCALNTKTSRVEGTDDPKFEQKLGEINRLRGQLNGALVEFQSPSLYKAMRDYQQNSSKYTLEDWKWFSQKTKQLLIPMVDNLSKENFSSETRCGQLQNGQLKQFINYTLNREEAGVISIQDLARFLELNPNSPISPALIDRVWNVNLGLPFEAPVPRDKYRYPVLNKGLPVRWCINTAKGIDLNDELDPETELDQRFNCIRNKHWDSSVRLDIDHYPEDDSVPTKYKINYKKCYDEPSRPKNFEADVSREDLEVYLARPLDPAILSQIPRERLADHLKNSSAGKPTSAELDRCNRGSTAFQRPVQLADNTEAGADEMSDHDDCDQEVWSYNAGARGLAPLDR